MNPSILDLGAGVLEGDAFFADLDEGDFNLDDFVLPLPELEEDGCELKATEKCRPFP